MPYGPPCTFSFKEMPEPVPPVQVRQPGIRFTTVDQNSVEVQVSVESQADALRHKQQQEAQQPMTQKVCAFREDEGRAVPSSACAGTQVAECVLVVAALQSCGWF